MNRIFYWAESVEPTSGETHNPPDKDLGHIGRRQTTAGLSALERLPTHLPKVAARQGVHHSGRSPLRLLRHY